MNRTIQRKRVLETNRVLEQQSCHLTRSAKALSLRCVDRCSVATHRKPCDGICPLLSVLMDTSMMSGFDAGHSQAKGMEVTHASRRYTRVSLFQAPRASGFDDNQTCMQFHLFSWQQTTHVLLLRNTHQDFTKITCVSHVNYCRSSWQHRNFFQTFNL